MHTYSGPEAAGYLSALEGAGVVLPPRLGNPEPIVDAVVRAGRVDDFCNIKKPFPRSVAVRGGDNWMPVPPHLREKVGDAVGSVLAEARALWLELPEHQEKAEELAKRAEEQAAARARFAVWQPGDAPLEKRKSRPPHAGYVPDPIPVYKRRK